ncbi:hypothetical protein M422DRAFT_164340, partial [Sphaerobolus stellatus SS14]
HSNLTLHDWMNVFQFMDEHKYMLQHEVVAHFKNKSTGALVFTQPAFWRKLGQQVELEAHINAHPNTLSGKRPCIVTRPDVEKAKLTHLRMLLT